MLLLVVSAPACLLGAPSVTNVRASQRTDGSGSVDVYYDLSGAIGTAYVILEFSSNDGTVFDVPMRADLSTGDVGTGVLNGLNKHIAWNAMGYQPSVVWANTKARVTAADEKLTLNLGSGATLDLIPLPKESFQMGASDAGWSDTDEAPVHTVNIDYELWMGKYEVTQKQWLAVKGAWPGTAPSIEYGLGDNYPAYFTSWNDLTNTATGFLANLNSQISSQTTLTLRLPSEAEWEYACRAGSTTHFSFGDSNCGALDCRTCSLGDYAWFCGNNSANGTKPVGGKLANAWGLYDMHGNVWEWCQDYHHDTYDGAPADGGAWLDPPDSLRVVRGGHWDYEPAGCRSSARNPYSPGLRSRYAGFRVAADVRNAEGTPEGISNTFTVDMTADPEISILPPTVQPPLNVPFSYTIYVRNNGTQTARGVVATHTLPPELEFISWTPSCGTAIKSGNTLTWSVCDLTTDTLASLLISAKANTFVQTTVSATLNTISADPNTSNNTALMYIEVAKADLKVELTLPVIHADLGAPFETTVSVTNLGPHTATGVVVTQTLLNGVDILSCAPQQGTFTTSTTSLNWNVGSVSAGATISLWFRAQGRMTTNGTVTATVTSTSYDPVTTNNTASISMTIGKANLLVVASDTTITSDVGVPFDYSLILYNAGPQGAENVVLTHTFPSGIEILSHTPGRGSCIISGNTLTWNVGYLEPAPEGARTLLGSTWLWITAKAVTCTSATASATAVSSVYDPDLSNNATSMGMEFEGLCVGMKETFSTNVTNPTPGGTTGWTPMSANQIGQTTDYDAVNRALRITVTSGTGPRVNGWVTANSEWLPYSAVGTDHYVRGKFYIFRAGQGNMADLNQIPAMRFRLANRFAVNSMLEVFSHLDGDAMGTMVGKDLRPSADPTSPSIYRVDFDPVDVLTTAPSSGEGVLRGFEAYCLEPQENGSIELTESAIGTYATSWLPDTPGPEVLRSRVYSTSASDAGDLKVFDWATNAPQISKYILLAPGILGAQVPLDGLTDPVYGEGAAGVTLDSTSVATNRLGIVARDFVELGANTDRIRVDAGRQYKLRFHVTSTTNSNSNPQLRLRARAVKFMWSQKLEIGGSFAAGNSNNAIAQKALPGVGCANPDQVTPGENGGWYTLLMNTPISPEIRDTQTSLTMQPGPGVDEVSIRDIKFGFDLLDTLSGSTSCTLEQGRFTLDRVEIREYMKVPD